MSEITLHHSAIPPSAPTPRSPVTGAALSRLQRATLLAGWEVDLIDVDLTREKPVAIIKCHRADGRWLWAKVDSLGRCSIETFHRESYLGKPHNAKGYWPQAPQIDDVFLGRQRPGDARALLVGVAEYIASNALHPVFLSDVQAAWEALVAEPVRCAALNAGTNGEPKAPLNR